MKTLIENTLENQAKFFAQYWGQRVLMYDGNDTGYPYLVNARHINDDGFYLELTPLSQITDEHAIEVGKILYNYLRSPNGLSGDEYHLKTGKDFISSYLLGKRNYLLEEVVDHLRSKGYPLPWMGLTIEKLIEYGWIRLKTKK